MHQRSSADNADILLHFRQFKVYRHFYVVVAVKGCADAVKEHVSVIREPASEDESVNVENLPDIVYAKTDVSRRLFKHSHCRRIASFAGLQHHSAVQVSV